MAAPALSTHSTPSKRTDAARLPVFDLLRAVAALLVFLYHYAGLVAPYTQGTPLLDAAEWLAARLGAIGTNLLLLLSGYFLAHNLATGRFSYRRFVWLRLVRIYVPYLAVLALALLFSTLAPAYTRIQPETLTWRVILEQALLLPGLFPDRPILTVTWTLSYIVAGYITLPAIGIALGRLQFAAPARHTIWASLVLINIVGGLTLGTPPVRFAYLPAGYLIFELQRTEWLPGHRRGVLRFSAALCLAAMLGRALLDVQMVGVQWPGISAQFAFVMSGLLVVSTIVFTAMVLQTRYSGLLRRTPFTHLAAFGRTGYSFYLVHGPVVKLFSLLVFPLLAARGLPAAAYWLATPLCAICAAGAAALLYLTVEKPCRHRLLGH